MTVNEIVKLFSEKPYVKEMGAGKISKWLGCNREDVYKARDLIRNKPKKYPKILIFDIETSPSIVYSFQRFKTNISLDQVIHDPIMLTWSAKWLFDEDVMSDMITPDEVRKFNDKRIVESLWNLLDKADITVAHYGNGFDTPFMNYRAIVNGLNPPHTAHNIDTKAIASKQFMFPSNKLDGIASYFGLEGKIKTDFDLWKGCLEGKIEKLMEMQIYNIKDVKVLEEVYLRMRPWIKGHVNTGLYMEEYNKVCPNCGSTNIKEAGNYYTQTGKFKTYRCECGALSRERFSNFDKDMRKNLLVSVGK